MISTLIISFLIIVTLLIVYLFNMGFVRGKMFDISTRVVKHGSKSEKYKNEMNENLNFIRSLPFEWLEITSFDGLILKGKYYDNNSDKLVMMFHGYRSIAENDFSSIFDFYYKLGFNILLINQRAHGESDGKYITFGINERHDVVFWCNYICEKITNVESIFLAGVSMGSTSILLSTALNLPDKVKGVIADCGFTSPKDIISKVLIQNYGMSPEVLLPLVNIFCKIFGKFNVYDCSVPKAMKENNLPILFIHGTSDDFVPSSMSKRNFKACNTDKKLVLVNCTNHGFSSVNEKEYVRNEIKNFVLNILTA